MKIFFRRFKSYLSILLLTFFLTYFAINYINLPPNENKAHKYDIAEKSKDKNLNQNNFDRKLIELPKELKKENPVVKNELLTIDNNENLLPKVDDNDAKVLKRYYAIDGNGLGAVNREVIKCSEYLEVEVVNSGFDKADFSYFLDSVPSRSNIKAISRDKKRHYFMVFAMESEPHSGGGSTWTNADFYMWYNLELSYPEPATYFDVKTHLPDLLAKPRIEFDQKQTDLAPLVWVLSNCNAFNSREKFVKRLMELIQVDSYGACLRNKNTHTSER